MAKSQSGQYSIHALLGPDQKTDRLLDRVMWPGEKRHTCLALSDENGINRREIHFFSVDAKGEGVENAQWRTGNLVAAAANALHLESLFNKIDRRTKFGDSLVRLKGQDRKGSPNRFKRAIELGRVSGPRVEIQEAWNRGLATVVRMNEADLPFTSSGYVGLRSNNCMAGTATVLNTMGPQFAALADIVTRNAAGYDLTERIAAMRWLSDEDLENLDQVVAEQAAAVLTARIAASQGRMYHRAPARGEPETAKHELSI